MSCIEIKELVGIKLTLKERLAPSQSIDLWLTNQPVLDLIRTEFQYFPVIESVTGLGVDMNEYTPKFTTGNITLDNSRDALAFEQRLTDLSGIYVIQGAEITIYSGILGKNSEDFGTQKTVVWKGEVQNVNYSTSSQRDRQRLTINVGRQTREWTVTKQINKNNTPDAPQQSLAKHIPMVLGFDQQVVPYSIGDVGRPLIDGRAWLYATMLRSEDLTGRVFANNGIKKFLTADLETGFGNTQKEYKQFYSVPNNATQTIYDQFNATVSTIVNINNQRAFPLNYSPDSTNSISYVVTGGNIVLRGDGTTPISGEIAIRLHGERNNFNSPKAPTDFLAEAIIKKTDYATDWATGTDFGAVFMFDKPVPIVSKDTAYYLSIQASDEDEHQTTLPLCYYSSETPAGRNSWRLTDRTNEKDSNKDVWTRALDNLYTTAKYQLNGLYIQDRPDGVGSPAYNGGLAKPDNNGIDVSYCLVFYQDWFGSISPETYFELKDFSKFDWLLEVDGLCDTNAVLEYPDGNPFPIGLNVKVADNLVNILLHEYIDRKWVEGNFNRFRFSDTHFQYYFDTYNYYRTIDGRTFNKVSNLQLIQEIARNSYSKFTYDFGSNSGYSLLAVGENRGQPEFYFNDKNCKVERYFVNQLNTVVNALDLNYHRRLDNVHFQTQRDQTSFADFAETYITTYNDGATGTELSNLSFQHYGERRLNDENYSLISNDDSIDSVARLILSLHDHPYQYAQIIAPYNIVKDLGLYSIVNIQSTELPYKYGTNQRAYWEDECQVVLGDYTKTKSYLAEIVSMTYNYSSNLPQYCRLLLRLITGENDPLNNGY